MNLQHQNILTPVEYSLLPPYSQRTFVLIKRKFGLFRAYSVENKLLRNQLSLLNKYLNKYKPSGIAKLYSKRPKILFAKKFNKLFFRAGRAILLTNHPFKKHTIQKNISKRFSHIIKQN